MIITVKIIVALYDMISVADLRHLFFLVDGHDGDDGGNSDGDTDVYDIISVTDS